jgi:predicted ATPase
VRIKALKIRQFKNLRDFQIAFDSAGLTTVVLGQNGSGKSNLLEAIVVIFRDLDLGEPPSFEYEIQYECRGKEVHVIAGERGKSNSIAITVDGQPLSYSSFWKNPTRQFLPSNVFGYYSGPSGRFESHFAKHQENFYRQLLENRAGEALRPLFYARLIHSQFVLLAFFYEEQGQTAAFLKEYLGIVDLESILFVLRQPPWSSKQGDRRFWYAKGAVQGFLDKLFRYALAPMRLKLRVDVDLSSTKAQEHLYLFLKDREALERLRVDYPSPGDFFKALESTYLSKLLAEVRIRVRVRDFSGALTFKELSEGEQQLLTVLGLLRFTREDEALFLLDEPDTHLNPQWSLRYLGLLKEVVGEQQTSQIIMTTHDPLTIGGMTRHEVRVMVRDQESGKIVAEVPEHDPKGMGVRGILTSELFGLRSDLDLATLQLLDEKRDLASKESLTKPEKVRLAELRGQTDAIDLSGRVSDPLVSEVVKTLASTPEFLATRSVFLTPEQRDKRRRLALQVLRKVEAEQESKS